MRRRAAGSGTRSSRLRSGLATSHIDRAGSLGPGPEVLSEVLSSEGLCEDGHAGRTRRCRFLAAPRSFKGSSAALEGVGHDSFFSARKATALAFGTVPRGLTIRRGGCARPPATRTFAVSLPLRRASGSACSGGPVVGAAMADTWRLQVAHARDHLAQSACARALGGTSA